MKWLLFGITVFVMTGLSPDYFRVQAVNDLSMYNSSQSLLHDLRIATIHKIETKSMKKCHYFPVHARQELYDGLWQKTVSKSLFPYILVYSPCMSTYNLGNSLGNYFNELACAASTNMSVIITFKLWDHPQMPFEYKGRNSNNFVRVLDKHHYTFFDHLPGTFDSPSSYLTKLIAKEPIFGDEASTQLVQSTIQSAVKSTCNCEKYCWDDATAPWVKQTALIKSIMGKALDAHLAAPETNAGKGTVLQPNSDISSMPISTFLPIVPNVAIHYRCGDTVPSTVYGFLPFKSIIELIPASSKHIYVMTDPAGRAAIMTNNKKFTSLCKPIVNALFDDLRKAFPAAVVVVKSGGDPLVDYIRLARANVTICAASTFCLWPAIASEGSAHFPVTSLIASWDAKKPDRVPNLGPNFNWIKQPRIITEFKDDTPLDIVLRVLRDELPRFKIP